MEKLHFRTFEQMKFIRVEQIFEILNFIGRRSYCRFVLEAGEKSEKNVFYF